MRDCLLDEIRLRELHVHMHAAFIHFRKHFLRTIRRQAHDEMIRRARQRSRARPVRAEVPGRIDARLEPHNDLLRVHQPVTRVRIDEHGIRRPHIRQRTQRFELGGEGRRVLWQHRVCLARGPQQRHLLLQLRFQSIARETAAGIGQHAQLRRAPRRLSRPYPHRDLARQPQQSSPPARRTKAVARIERLRELILARVRLANLLHRQLRWHSRWSLGFRLIIEAEEESAGEQHKRR